MIPATPALEPSAPQPTELDARAHAIKDCLSVIVGLASTLERHVEASARPRVSQLLRASRSLSNLMVDDARPAALARAEASVADILRRVADRLGPQAEREGIPLVVDCGGGTIVGDAEGLAEALYNVVSNALHASRPGCRIRITTRRSDEGDQEWTVEDSGCGMPAKLLPLLGSRCVSSGNGGMGLGMSLALQTIHRHDGVVRVESAPGRGTAVRIWLPGSAAVDADALR